jgi:hypothetical protein
VHLSVLTWCNPSDFHFNDKQPDSTLSTFSHFTSRSHSNQSSRLSTHLHRLAFHGHESSFVSMRALPIVGKPASGAQRGGDRGEITSGQNKVGGAGVEEGSGVCDQLFA